VFQRSKFCISNTGIFIITRNKASFKSEI
jgi:hypothetical protein